MSILISRRQTYYIEERFEETINFMVLKSLRNFIEEVTIKFIEESVITRFFSRVG